MRLYLMNSAQLVAYWIIKVEIGRRVELHHFKGDSKTFAIPLSRINVCLASFNHLTDVKMTKSAAFAPSFVRFPFNLLSIGTKLYSYCSIIVLGNDWAGRMLHTQIDTNNFGVWCLLIAAWERSRQNMRNETATIKRTNAKILFCTPFNFSKNEQHTTPNQANKILNSTQIPDFFSSQCGHSASNILRTVKLDQLSTHSGNDQMHETKNETPLSQQYEACWFHENNARQLCVSLLHSCERNECSILCARDEHFTIEQSYY